MNRKRAKNRLLHLIATTRNDEQLSILNCVLKLIEELEADLKLRQQQINKLLP